MPRSRGIRLGFIRAPQPIGYNAANLRRPVSHRHALRESRVLAARRA